jgi:hypothetical protein
MVSNKLPLYCSPREWDYLRGICLHGAPRCSLAATRMAGCVACITAGSLTRRVPASICRMSRLRAASKTRSARQHTARATPGPSNDDARAAAARVDAEERDTLRMRGWILSFDFLGNLASGYALVQSIDTAAPEVKAGCFREYGTRSCRRHQLRGFSNISY